jgi:hypothetical protein
MTKYITFLQALAATPVRLMPRMAEVGHSTPQAMAHILQDWIAVERQYFVWFRLIVQQENPNLTPDCANRPISDGHVSLVRLCDQFHAARMQTLAFLGEQAPEQWQRAATHHTFGRTTLQLLVQTLIDFDTVQLNLLTEQLGQKNWEITG